MKFLLIFSLVSNLKLNGKDKIYKKRNKKYFCFF